MKWMLVVAYALLMPNSFATGPQQGHPAKTESPGRFVQGFYDWYIRRAIKDSGGPAWSAALKARSKDFNPRLLKALRDDLAAQARSSDSIVGLDFDPFLNSQYPEGRYLVGTIVHRGAFYWVSVHNTFAGKRSTKPTAVAKLEMKSGHWRFTDFSYPTGQSLLGILRREKRNRH